MKSTLLSKIVIALIAAALLVAPMFWFPSDMTYLYGDDGVLYFLSPGRYTMKSAYLWSNYGGTGEVNTIMPAHIPFSLFLSLLRGIGLNAAQTEKLTWGLVLSAGFIFTYLFLREIIGRRSTASQIGSLVGALAFVLSPIVIMVDWATLLLEVYLVAFVPVLSYFYLKCLTTLKPGYILGFFAAIVLGSPFIVQIPWTAGVAIGFLFFLVPYYLTVLKPAVPLKRMVSINVILFGSLALLQAFWIVPLLAVGSGTSVSGLVDMQSAYSIIMTVAQRMNVFDYFLMLYPQSLAPNSYRIGHLHPWFYSFKLFHLLIPLTLSAAVLLSRGRERKIMASLTGAFAVVLYLGTVNVTDFGINLFWYLTKHVPGWTMFRNFQGKFPFAIGYFYALAVGYAIFVLVERYGMKAVILPLLMSAVLIFKAVPFITGSVVTSPCGVNYKSAVVTRVPPGYEETMRCINEQPGDFGTAMLPFIGGSGWGLYKWDKGFIGHNPAFLLLDDTVLNDLWSLGKSVPLNQWMEKAVATKDYNLFSEVLDMTSTRYLLLHKDFDYDHTASWGFLLKNMANAGETSDFLSHLDASLVAETKDFSLYEMKDSQPRIFASQRRM